MMGMEIECRASAHSLFTNDQMACCNSSMLSFKRLSLAILISIPKLTKDHREHTSILLGYTKAIRRRPHGFGRWSRPACGLRGIPPPEPRRGAGRCCNKIVIGL